MSGSNWDRIEVLFHGALEQSEEQRRAWVERECGADPALCSQVLELLAADAEGASEEDLMAASVAQELGEIGTGDGAHVGRALGPWRVLEALGAGGMGSVFLAERDDDEYDRKVAIKLIRGFPDPASLQRLRDERQILADLNHPNIAAMIDGGTTDDGQPYLVMEYIEGRPVDAWCRERGVGLETRIRVIRTLCDAVHHAHQRLVIHRDLKPENALVTADGRPVLLDFGIAKLLEAEAGDEASGVTRSTGFYTPGFSSPEQAQGRPVSTVTDVYSMGRMLGLLLEESGETIPSDLRAIVEKATAEEPDDRYASMAGLNDDLGRYLDGFPVLAAAGRWRYRARKFVARYRWPLAAALAVALVGAGLVRQVIIESEQSRQAEARALVEAANANQVLEFLIGMIESAEPGTGEGRELRVLDVLDQAQQDAGAGTIDDPEVRARVLFSIGRLYRVLELYAPAGELLTQAADLAAETGDLPLQVEALSIAGMSAVLSDRVDDAERLLDEAVGLARAHPDLPGRTRASAINNLGVLYNESDRQELAFELITEALELRRVAGAPPESIATSLHNLGEALDLQGRPAEALTYYRDALALKRDSIGRMHPSYARSLNGIALTAGQIGQYEVAREAIEEQLEIRLELFGPEHPGLTRDYNELAINHLDMGEYREAVEDFERAMAYDAMAPGGATSTWLMTNNIGAAYRDGGLPERAAEYFQRAIELRTERFGPDDSATWRARHNLASALYAMGRYAEAAALLDEVVAGRRRVLGDEHPDLVRSLALQLTVQTALDPGLDPAGRDAWMQQLIDALAERFSPEGSAVLTARRQRAEQWLLRGELERADQEFAAVAELVRSTLREGHPSILTAELERARIDLLEGRSEAAEGRLARLRDDITASFSDASIPARMLACMEQRTLDPACWAVGNE